MKILLLVFIIALSVVTAFAQKSSRYNLQVDTIEKRNDSTLFKISSFKNNDLVEEFTAFLFDTTIRVPRYRLTGNLFKSTIHVSRVLRHGKTVEYLSGEVRKITTYNHGNASYLQYLDKNNNEALPPPDENKLILICGRRDGEFIVIGNKKK